LLFTHAISVLAFLPALFIFSLYHYSHLLKLKKVVLLSFIIPIIGFLFYWSLLQKPFYFTLKNLIFRLIFNAGWGVIEFFNSPFETFSFIGYFFAIFGILFILRNRKKMNQEIIYVFWCISLFFMLLFFKTFHFSLLSPFQRNMYYFTLSLPILGSLGINYFFQLLNKEIKNKRLFLILKVAFCFIIIILLFVSYFSIHPFVRPRQIITEQEYEVIYSLRDLDQGTVMAQPLISEAIFQISGHRIIATNYFYGNPKIPYRFFNRGTSCEEKNKILKKHNVDYILSKNEINCSWDKLYSLNNYHVYKV
jgi:hypothetical protein